MAQEVADKSIPTLANELVDLIKAYVRQETIEPAKGLGKHLARKTIGGLLLGAGFTLALLGVLRVLQAEVPRFSRGAWTAVPYAIAFGAGLIIVVIALAAGRRRR